MWRAICRDGYLPFNCGSFFSSFFPAVEWMNVNLLIIKTARDAQHTHWRIENLWWGWSQKKDGGGGGRGVRRHGCLAAETGINRIYILLLKSWHWHHVINAAADGKIWNFETGFGFVFKWQCCFPLTPLDLDASHVSVLRLTFKTKWNVKACAIS